MKKLLLPILAVLGLATASLNAASGSQSFTLFGTNVAVLTNGGYILDTIQVIPSGTNTTTRLFDWDNKVITYTNDAYITRAREMSNVVTTFVTSTGVTNSFTNAVEYVRVYTNAASTNTLTPLLTVVTPAGTVGTYTLNFPLINGLTISNDVTSTVIYNYRSQ